MESKIARVTWKRGQYSDVHRSTIIDPSPLREGQKVKVVWGKTRKEYAAVVACYPLEEEVNQTRGAGAEKQRTHLTQSYDNHEIMVLETFSALNTRVYRNIGVLKLICENERTISDTFSDKNTCTDLNYLV